MTHRVVVMTAAARAAAACSSDPVYYGDKRYSSPSYARVADLLLDGGRVLRD